MPRNPSRTVPAARLSDLELPALDPDSPPWPGRTVSLSASTPAGGAAGTPSAGAAGTPSGGACVELYVTHAEATVPDAEPALMVHGLGGSTNNWTDLAGLLRTRLDVEAIDLLGHGRSGPAPDRDYSQRAHARTVIAYLERSGRGPVHLIGNSMGGAISLRVASERPDLVRTLTLISPAVPDVRRLRAHPLKNDPRMALLLIPGIAGMALRQLGRTAVDKRVKATIALCFADFERYPKNRLEQDIAEARERMAMPWANEAMLRSMRGLARVQFTQARATWEAMRSIKAPSLVVWGDTDRLVAPDLAGFVAAAIPDSRLLMLEQTGHTAMMEDPVTTARAFFGLLENAATPSN